MKERKKEDRKCGNCRYFSQHYAKNDQRYHAVSCGHCLNEELGNRTKKKDPYNILCGFWEPIEIRKAERKKAIKDILLTMANRIEEMSVILKEDEINIE